MKNRIRTKDSVLLRVFVEKPIVYSGCGRVPYRKTDDYQFFPSKQALETLKTYLPALKEEFGDRLRIEVVDPRNILFFFDVLKYGVKGTNSLWVIKDKDGKVVEVYKDTPPIRDIKNILVRLLEENNGHAGLSAHQHAHNI
ncbi:hypothetical protein GM182_01345 [bacterium 3DAC]|nr:hypothetical protein GM182_01345 [bacterium 3DAC]